MTSRPVDPSPGYSLASEAPWARTVDEVIEDLDTDLRLGLSTAEADDRRRRFGPNELEAAKPPALLRRIGRQFTDPLVVLLLVAIGISIIGWLTEGRDGAPLEAIVIAAIVVINAVIGTWQEDRAIKAVEALRRLAASHANVVRDGRVQPVVSSELVPGDIVLFGQGDAVGADCRLCEVASLAIAEAALTGESDAVDKSTSPIPEATPLADRVTMAFQGTAVTIGRGRGVVVATGMSSEIGRIARLIDAVDRTDTPLQRQIDWLSKALGVVVLALASLVVAVIVATSDVSTFAGFVDALLVGVSLAVAAVPEGLPAILTIVLAMGVQRMAANNAIVKRLSSVETLGSAAVICTDKTGTLTRNEMSIVEICVSSGRFDIGIEGVPPEVGLVVTAGSIANDATLHLDSEGRWELTGDPTEIAFLLAEETLGLRPIREGTARRIDEIPFDSDRKLMSTINEYSPTIGLGGPDEPWTMFTKGAPDILFDRCDSELVGGTAVALTTPRKNELLSLVDTLADQALRPLAVAYRAVPDLDAAAARAETGLTLLGVVGITDPPRPEAFQAIDDAQRGGVRVVMITGDHPRTAVRIAAQLGLSDPESAAVTGDHLERLSDDELAGVVATTSVYARVDPEHKLRLVRALQRDGLVTAMTGDGVNDAPALRQADIGVAMGLNGTEVSKEAADVILGDDNFATIIRAVREGREIFNDIRKFLRYLLASNSGEVLVVLFGVLFASSLGLGGDAGELAVPLLATQILWINLVTDGALALALGVDPAVENVMDRPPRGLDERVIDGPMLKTIMTLGIATALVSLAALDLGLSGGLLGGTGDIDSARTMAFTTLVLAQVCNAFSARSDRVSAFVDPFANRLLWGAAVLTVAAQVAVVHLPGISAAFETESLSGWQWLVCAALASAVLVVAELFKLIVRSRSRPRGDVGLCVEQPSVGTMELDRE